MKPTDLILGPNGLQKQEITGRYCSFVPGSKAYADFWHAEYVKCRDGLTVNGYTITGPHYFFLNYYQLPNTDSARAGSSRGNIYPNFYAY